MPKAYGRSYRPVGVVFVPWTRVAPSVRPFAPKRAGADPAATHPPPRRSHQVNVPVVESARGAWAVISCVPPPVSASRSGRGGGPAGRAASEPARASRTDAVTRSLRMLRTVRGPAARPHRACSVRPRDSPRGGRGGSRRRGPLL